MCEIHPQQQIANLFDGKLIYDLGKPAQIITKKT